MISQDQDGKTRVLFYGKWLTKQEFEEKRLTAEYWAKVKEYKERGMQENEALKTQGNGQE